MNLLWKAASWVAAATLLVVLLWVVASWQRVETGHVGIRVYLLGNERGIDAEVLGVGRHFIGWQQELYQYPTFVQNYVWTAAGEDETSPNNESITFQDNQGLEINADIGIEFTIDGSKAHLLFQEYRRGVPEIVDGPLYNRVRDSLARHAGGMSVEDIYGQRKQELMDRVFTDVRDAVADQGIIVRRVNLLGAMRLPRNVLDALNAKIEATQRAQQRENEVAEAIAAANKAREEARGVADAQLLRAQAEAEAIRIRGEALRENAALVELTLAERWDGKLPNYYVGGGSGEGRILQILAPPQQ